MKSSVRKRVLGESFVQCSDWVLFDKTLSANAVRLYQVLIKFCRGSDSKCFPGQEGLAKSLGVTTRAIRNYLNELTRRGLVTVENRGNKTNVYWLESVSGVYGSEEDRTVPSEQALKDCWSPFPLAGFVSEHEPELKEDPSTDLAQISSRVTATMQASQQRSADRARKTIQRRASRVPNKKAQKKRGRTVQDSTKMKKLWEVIFAEVFPSRTQKWETKHTIAVKNLLDTYGLEVTEKAIEAMIRQWESRYQRVCRITGSPNVCILWGYRDTILPEIEEGRYLDPKRSKQDRLRDDEYQEGATDNAEPGQW